MGQQTKDISAKSVVFGPGDAGCFGGKNTCTCLDREMQGVWSKKCEVSAKTYRVLGPINVQCLEQEIYGPRHKG